MTGSGSGSGLEEGMDDVVRELANVIYHEARGESRTGQAAVAYVVLNRVADKRFPNTVKEVIWQRNQFSGIRYHVGYREFEPLAREVLAGNVRNPIGNALFFANRRGNCTIRIGNHCFWR